MDVQEAKQTLAMGVAVRHRDFKIGSVLLDNGKTVVVRFAHGIEECARVDLSVIVGLEQKLRSEIWDIPLEVIHRLQAEAILSVNDTWGVFSRSRVALLPHQLWVCRQVNSHWPARWLVADDVGLGKTIEAGMILWPLLARGTVRRLLILCPASLVEQWQYRMREMFDIRLTRYTSEADTPRSDFWNTQTQVVASLHTVRMDQHNRRERLLAADPWDMVVVDEAHHLNADEQTGNTLGYRLVKELLDARRVRSMLFFTGTPHRGKDYGFLSLLQLLRADLFDARKPGLEQMAHLPQVMIRNNKSAVTDLQGNRLFQPPLVISETYRYSPDEQAFYDLLTRFIATGQAYASRLSSTEGRAVMLVLIAMQKLASSSVAAIRRAIQGRVMRLRDTRKKTEDLQKEIRRYQELEQGGDEDDLAAVEEQIAAITSALQLMQDEEPALRELLIAAERVQDETKISAILRLIEERFPDRSLLFFTEYKATQSLLMSALMQRYGDDCVTFINGDARAEGIITSDGRGVTRTESRENAASKFNSGQIRFLVSTEAGGEGIDLQARCYTLIHVDLPWNPMRLHQRVGRLNRYGQTRRVEVMTLRNPETVEALIWDKLNAKLEIISRALGQVMDEPEDLLQLVLGMTSQSLFREIFSGAATVPVEALGNWFDQKAATFGGQEVVDAVRQLVGNASRFDFQQVSERLPRVDLPDLVPFLDIGLMLNNRRLREEEGKYAFITPDAWRDDPAIQDEYENVHFNRLDSSPDEARNLLGVGHRVFGPALVQATGREAWLASFPTEALPQSLFCYRLRDRVTGQEGKPRALIFGVEMGDDGQPALLLDWQLLLRLNGLSYRKALFSRPALAAPELDQIELVRAEIDRFLVDTLSSVDHPFQVPEWELTAILWTLS